MSTFYSFLKNNKKHHKTITINSVKDFFDLALRLMEDEKYIYRGINANNQKYPKIIRAKDLSKFEEKILKEFEKYYGLYSKIPNFWEFIALAQHHGLKTRLIDFTNNIFVSAFFSLYKKSNESTYKIFVYNRDSFKDSSEWNRNLQYVSEPDDRMADNVMVAFESFKERGGDFILTPHYSNNRMFVQQGLFVIPSLVNRDHIDKLYNQSDIEINISPYARKHILNRLKRLGYDEYRLMPDLDSVCNEINGIFDEY